jgi:HAD superfamily hydrolase (TIGR01509 family)
VPEGVGEGSVPAIDAVIFDMDGVIVDTEPVWGSVRTEFAAGLGRVWGAEDQRHVAGVSSREWAAIMRDRLGIGMPEVEIQRAIVDAMVGRLRTDGPPHIDGAVEAVRALAGRYPSALASGAHPEIIAAVLEATGLAGAFRAVVSAEDVERGKPQPDVFLEAARRLGCPPERCLVIEDSLFGVRAGRAAGMVVILVPNPNAPDTDTAKVEADHVVARLDLIDPRRLERTPAR